MVVQIIAGVASCSSGGGGDDRKHRACGRGSPGQVDRRAVVRVASLVMHHNHNQRSARACGNSGAQQHCKWTTHLG